MAEDDRTFVEMQRTFRELSKASDESDDVDLQSAYYTGSKVGWPSVLENFRVVLLSEAGSGKTEEIRNVARNLRSQGKAAFFLRLEHVTSDFEEAFEEATFADFQAWLASEDEGWVLLDSVDEARLRSPSDFELAIKKIARRIAAAQQRTHVVITGRTTAWRPKTDLALCSNLLPYSAPRAKAVGVVADDSGADGAVIIRENTKSRGESTFKVMALEDLTPAQVEIFASACGVEDTKALRDEIERADAYSFTARPQDLAEIVEFWNIHKRIGSRLELMRNSIERRLTERDQTRALANPMTVDKAQRGARIVAGATTLTQRQTIRVPDGAEYLDGLPITSILPDWDEKDCATLLSRPIFDEAIYGSVRFHHRSVREYLAAFWLTKLLERETSRRAIEEIFFREQYGLEVVVPSARPLLPWMILLDQKIRDRALRLAPELVFEGGDPSQLPVDLRRRLLRKICVQVATRRTSRSGMDFAVQRFASAELTDDISELLSTYAGNGDVTWLLLRMVWQGRMAGVVPAAKIIALDPKAAKYSRVAGMRAVEALGAPNDLSDIRSSFLAERRALDRTWLAELVGSAKPSAENVKWLLAALEKAKPKEQFSTDGLATAVVSFVAQADPTDLITLVEGFAKLLEKHPHKERRYCEISVRYRWLTKIAAYAVERLVELKHEAALGDASLSILRKVWMAEDRDEFSLRDVALKLSTLVPEWRELHDALFWYEVAAARKSLDRKKGERLTEWWRISFDSPYWAWKESDFQTILNFIAARPLLDDRLVALSIAFHLYRAGKRQPQQRRALWKAVRGQTELETTLHTYLNPPKQSDQERSWKSRDRQWKLQQQRREDKEAKHHADWQTHLLANIASLRDARLLKLRPDQVSNAQYYLHHRLDPDESNNTRWRGGNWETLIPKHGEEVARAFRDGAVGFWRRNRPKLRSEGAEANKTLFSTIFGLCGLQIEASETEGWPRNLSEADAELAARYATYELNGFPDWFGKLYDHFPDAVTQVLLGEVRWEVAKLAADSEGLGTLYDISWYGEVMWERSAPILLQELAKQEPQSVRALSQMLKIVQGSSLPAEQIRDLAREKCNLEGPLDHLARWYAAWVGVDPDHGIPALEQRLVAVTDDEARVTFAMEFLTHLLGGRHGESSNARNAYRTASYLKALYLLMNEHIRPRDDIERAGKGVYSPGLRDNAQEARNHLSSLLEELPGKEAFVALMEIAKAHPEKNSRPWFAMKAKSKAEQDVETGPWSVGQFVEFNAEMERTPANHRELFELAWMRMLDLKDDLERGDSSIATTLQKITLEPEMRKNIGNWLRDRAKGRYTVPQEEELADATKPDVRFQGGSFDGPVPMELKLADNNWSGAHLFERLENQLCGDYLRDNRSSRGIFCLVWRGEKKQWQLPNSKKRVDFDGLIIALQTHWKSISERFPGIDEVRVIGIDLTKRAKKPQA